MISFKTKPEIALEQIDAACEAGLPRGVVLMDAGYGCNTDLRTSISALALTYVAGILPNTTVWAPGTAPLPPKKWSGRGRPPKLHAPRRQASADLGQGACAWLAQARLAHDRMARRRGRAAVLALCSRAGSRRASRLQAHREPAGRMAADRVAQGRGRADQILALDASAKTSPSGALVDLTKLRWRIERDYQELKQEVGLGHFEGRGWRGFHHHATLCIAAYGFLISERETIPPSGPRSAALFQQLAVPDGYRPRGSAAAARTAHPELDRDHAPTADRRSRQKPAAMSMLRRSNRTLVAAQKFMTQ